MNGPVVVSLNTPASLVQSAQKTAVLGLRTLVPSTYLPGTQSCTQKTDIFCDDYTSEADCSQSDYYGAVHVLWLILVRTNGAWSSSYPPTLAMGQIKSMYL